MEQKFDCTCCLKTFSGLLKMKRHQLLHTGRNYFRFHYNNWTELGNLLALKTARNDVYSRDKYFNCFLYCKYFHTNGIKNNHINRHYDIKFQFRKNSMSICELNSLTSHVPMQPVFNVKRMLSCDKCLKTLSLKIA